jgi:hypothetical protein
MMELLNLDWQEKLGAYEDVEDMWTVFREAFLEAERNTIAPMRAYKGLNKHATPLFKVIREKIKEKKLWRN